MAKIAFKGLGTVGRSGGVREIDEEKSTGGCPFRWDEICKGVTEHCVEWMGGSSKRKKGRLDGPSSSIQGSSKREKGVGSHRRRPAPADGSAKKRHVLKGGIGLSGWGQGGKKVLGGGGGVSGTRLEGPPATASALEEEKINK